MNRIAAIATLIVAAASVSPAFAQADGVKADIPFAFNVNGTSLSAGTYLIRTDGGGSHLLTLHNREDGNTIMTLGWAGDATGVKDNVLVFHRYGDKYFLSQIRTADSSMNYSFPATKAEKQARAVTEEAKLTTNTPVLIALK